MDLNDLIELVFSYLNLTKKLTYLKLYYCLHFIVCTRVLIWYLENGIAVRNIVYIIKTYLISFFEPTEQCPTLLLKIFHLVP